MTISDVELPRAPVPGGANPDPTTQPTAGLVNAALLTVLSGRLTAGESVAPPALATIMA